MIQMNIPSRSIAVLFLLLAIVVAIRSWDSGVVDPESAPVHLTERKVRNPVVGSHAASSSHSGSDVRQVVTPPPTSVSEQDSDAVAETSEDITEPEQTSPALAEAVEFRRNLRKEIEDLDETSGQLTILQPAAWVDLGDDPAISTAHSQGIQRIAEELKQQIAESGLDPASPEYRRLWNRAVRESDWKFRARYGARAWTRHHIQAHHMATADRGK